jgi:hypothetical protein
LARAYVPSLEVSEYTILTRQRRLPLQGDVHVKVGETVSQETIVASTELPGKPVPVSASVRLGVNPGELPDCMLKKEGDSVAEDECLAVALSFFGWVKTPLLSPIHGFLDSISGISGQIILREAPIPVEVNAYVQGEVVDVETGEGVTIKTHAALVQGIFGVGNEKIGELILVVENRSMVLTPEHIHKEHSGKILIAGSLMTHEAIEKARDLGVLGIIGGGLNDQDLKKILGYDLGVAITGNEEGPTLVITEGFGEIEMAERTFNLLASHEGKKASINGATQIRAGVIRPEVIIPIDSAQAGSGAVASDEGKIIEMGAMVRIIRDPHFGELGEIIELPQEPQEIPSGAKVRVVVIRLSDNSHWTLPRANLEIV